MADLDLTALRIRLAELEGLDHQALWVHHQPTFGDWVIATQPARAPYLDCAVSAEHAATRDRLARWCAGRVGRSVGPTGPCWGPVANSYEGGGWGLLPRLGHGMCIFMRPDWLPLAALPPLVPGGESVWVGVPALAALDPADPRLLPDGSRWVDAAALVAVARHLGGGTDG